MAPSLLFLLSLRVTCFPSGTWPCLPLLRPERHLSFHRLVSLWASGAWYVGTGSSSWAFLRCPGDLTTSPARRTQQVGGRSPFVFHAAAPAAGRDREVLPCSQGAPPAHSSSLDLDLVNWDRKICPSKPPGVGGCACVNSSPRKLLQSLCHFLPGTRSKRQSQGLKPHHGLQTTVHPPSVR